MSIKTAFLFSGQGAQFVGMGQDLYDEYDKAKEYFEIADQVVPGLQKICFEGPEEELRKTNFQQPGIFALSCILNDLVREKGLNPDITAGFSLGEYAALYSAGVFDSLDLSRL